MPEANIMTMNAPRSGSPSTFGPTAHEVRPFVIRESAQRRLGACSVGVMLLASDRVTLALSAHERDPGQGWDARVTLKKGESLPCGDLFPIVALGELEDRWGGGRGVVFDERGGTLAGVTLRAEGIPIVLGGQTTIGDFELELVSLAAGGAELALTHAGVVPAARRTLQVKPGDPIEIGRRKYSVNACVPTDGAAGVVGWIELVASGGRRGDSKRKPRP